MAKYDLGQKTIQCGRKNDATKLWLYWQKHGLDGFEKIINHGFDVATYMADQIEFRKMSAFGMLIRMKKTF